MEIMGVNIVVYLVMLKVIVVLFVIFMLVVLVVFISIIGGYFVFVLIGLMFDVEYVFGVWFFFEQCNIIMMFVKFLVFVFILIMVFCYQGYYVKGGSIELGKVSINVVVFSDILILLVDYLIVIILIQI